ncbi:hypothetical protein [Flavobacterium sp.]|uniref:hypothetical protein n=1 Tax=Flavobacterium sp. TaxID=239 RepID=UPI003B9AF31C
MKKEWLVVVLLFCCWMSSAQNQYSLRRESTFFVESDSLQIDSTSIRKIDFEIFDENNRPLPEQAFRVDFTRARLYILDSSLKNTQLLVRYSKYPDFLTKSYVRYAPEKVLGNVATTANSEPLRNTRTPFEGLSTNGSITRGVTVGNNQNSVVNSNLDLQISGKLSDKVSLRASIQDSNIPLQDNGYSQRLDEFDQIFIELAGSKWNIRAGDLFLENRSSRFLNFSKKVQGVRAGFRFGDESATTDVFASAALVRGAYARSTFTGTEGNQGPYKLTGPNGEPFILVVSGSERVFVNGIQLERGENNQYVIDYNAGEITFTSLFQITSEMRINVEYQYAERNFTRLVTYAGANHSSEKWNVSGAIYSENDVKNQPLQQNLSPEQAAVLGNAGDDDRLMVAPSENQEPFDENKIQYRKEIVNDATIFVYSTNPNDTLFSVRFTDVGAGNGNYQLQSTTGTGKIYVYVAPINGVKQGSFEPVIKLIAPQKLQLVQVSGGYRNGENTTIQAEFAGSLNDKNLYSSLDDADNTGVAFQIDGAQLLFKRKFKTQVFASAQYIGERFRTVERAVSIEFNRDWNVSTQLGDQKLVSAGFTTNLNQKGSAMYKIETLQFGSSYSGFRQLFDAQANLSNWQFSQKFSFLKTTANFANSSFLRNLSRISYRPTKKAWIHATHAAEDNSERLKATNQLSNLSQRFNEFGGRVGVGDSLKVFVEGGVLLRLNDSLVNQRVSRVNQSLTYLVRSRVFQSEQQDLMLFASFRKLTFEDKTQAAIPSLNSRIAYNGRFLNRLLVLGTTYENSSGTVAQQEFSYIEVEPGQGLYTWNDYNNNGVKELEEFEIAPFPDQAIYLRVFLPNQIFVPSHVNRLSQNLTLNFAAWKGSGGFSKFLKKISNQASFITERKIRRSGSDFDLNPFGSSGSDVLGQTLTFRNSLFYNRGKQNHSVTFNATSSSNIALISSGLQENKLRGTQLLYAHLIQKTWLFSFQVDQNKQKSTAQNYLNRSFEITGYEFEPKVSYLFSTNVNFDISAAYGEKENTLGAEAFLVQRKLTLAFNWNTGTKLTANGEFNLIGNNYLGEANTAAAFQMLEALQPGQNTTWRLSVQKSLTGFLDLTLNYQGRKSELSSAIHTGTVQLRAHF